MLQRLAWHLAFIAVCLQVAVFLQPLLPPAWQISPVCATISQAMQVQNQHDAHAHADHAAQQRDQHRHDHAAAEHDCPYCKVYGNVLPSLELDFNPVIDRWHVRLLLWQQRFVDIYFVLQRLYLTPQGRAPPIYSLF